MAKIANSKKICSDQQVRLLLCFRNLNLVSSGCFLGEMLYVGSTEMRPQGEPRTHWKDYLSDSLGMSLSPQMSRKRKLGKGKSVQTAAPMLQPYIHVVKHILWNKRNCVCLTIAQVGEWWPRRMQSSSKKIWMLENCKVFSSNNPSFHQISGFSRTFTHSCLTRVNKTWCCVLCGDRRRLCSQWAASLFPPCDHHQTHLAMWRCSHLFTWGVRVCFLKDFSLFLLI